MELKVGKRKTKRIFRAAAAIEPSEYQLQLVVDGLNVFYDANKQFLKTMSKEDKIDEVIQKCKEGWICAPKDFVKRVEVMTKWNSKNVESRPDYKENYHTRKMVEEELKMEKAEETLYQGQDGKSLRRYLNKEEKKTWVEREAYYRKEFELNDSADWPLLQQILVEEIHQNRIAIMRLRTDPNNDMDQQMNESQRRLINAMKSLGITREQRQGATHSTEGSVSQLAEQYEMKKKLIKKQMQKDTLEEQIMEMKKQTREGLVKLRQMGFDRMATDLARAE